MRSELEEQENEKRRGKNKNLKYRRTEIFVKFVIYFLWQSDSVMANSKNFENSRRSEDFLKPRKTGK